MSGTGTQRAWHAWYQRFAPTSPEVYALQALEPADLEEWAIKLRQEFPTVPPNGIEMCHARWLETIDRLIEDIGDMKFSRRSHWCGDIPAETIAGLGLRRRVLQAWLKNTPREQLLSELSDGLGQPPDIADLLFDLLGDMRSTSQAVRQDIEVLADMFSGPFEAGNAPIMAKWRARYEGLRERGSILAQLGDRYYPVLTNLCNYRTLSDADRLIGMVARQSIEPQVLGPCNWSLKFMLTDEPERLSASLAAVWALHRYAATEFHAPIESTPLGVRDQMNAFNKRLGHSNAVKAWLAASLGFVIKKWVRRAWHIMEIEIPDGALPDFSFPEEVKSREAGGEVVSLESQPTERVASATGKHEVIAASAGKSRSKAPRPPGAEGEADAEAEGSTDTPAAAEQKEPVGTELSDAAVPQVEMHPQRGETLSQGTLPRPDAEEATGETEGQEDAPGEQQNDASPDTAQADANQADAGETADDAQPSIDSDADWESPQTIGGTTRILTSSLKKGEGEAEGEEAAEVEKNEGATE